MKHIQKIFEWITLLFFGIAIYAMTIGQTVPIEFIDWHHMHFFYDIILQGLPIAILLTLAWTLKKDRPKKTNIAIGILTPIIAGVMFFGIVFLMFSYGFGAWVDEQIIYENRENPNVTINQQLWDIGAFGYGGQRTVKLTPILGLWNWAEQIDTAEIKKENWTLVQKQGAINFP
ncbi:hypothetical protein ACT3CD_11730 [Geofilum sp. OHC36d9]|uniref:hypothetical protein n=1 Tax=Geofilum sp. OHC36d9 TaxID=3458413 RepID=UPI00403488D1